MKFKIMVWTVSLAVLGFTFQVSAHDFWAESPSPKAGQKVSAIIGYGHNFPAGE
jgi:hypothetical protein